MWSVSGEETDKSNKAWCNNFEGLVTASIEAKNYETREIKPIVVCPGQDFRNFQWVCVASVSPFALKGKNQVPHPKVVGLKMMTREEEITAFETGSLKRDPFKAENLNFATYGK
jgi:hypothetical protein